MQEEETVPLLKALADKTRLEIVRRLAKEEDCSSCTEISSGSMLSQPAMSHHFRKLVDSNVVLERKKGKEKVYELNKALLRAKGINPKQL